ncbi:MAG: flagellar assembly protein FliW [Anaerovibrio sp.]|uniref:flagellar assembly protein FliW n=1 Tax=Anaerovibrio sp. TaxID=1872532 RepID=UPI0025E13DD4|nr:flagellar assembly protein FliW [Anaerovibrio sp.]MCR5176725.1 flagellar assembly protein FliW [Anaerovibrio sp.]
MKNINTTRFGEIEVEDDSIIVFDHGIPAFEDEHEFTVLPYDAESPYLYLQSVSSPELAFLMTDPFVFFPDYTFELDDANMKELGVSNDADVLVCSLITVPPTGVPDMTTNLLAPIVINQANMKAKQIVLEKTSYTTKHRLFPKKKEE